MHNFLDQEIGQMTQRTTEFAVEVLPARVRCDLGRKTRQEAIEGLRAVALQEEDILELVYDPLDDLTLATSPSPCSLLPRLLALSCGVAATRAPYSASHFRSQATEEKPLSAR